MTMNRLRLLSRPLQRQRARPGASRGIALIEALIAILIFSFGVLGIVGLQASMTRAQGSAKFRADASYLANELMGSMWADIPNLSQYDTASTRCDAYARCQAWKTKVQGGLPGGEPVVAAAGDGSVTITINWSVPGEGDHRYQTRTRVLTVD